MRRDKYFIKDKIKSEIDLSKNIENELGYKIGKLDNLNIDFKYA